MLRSPLFRLLDLEGTNRDRKTPNSSPRTPSTSVWDNLLQGQNIQEMLGNSHVWHHLTYLHVDNPIMTRKFMFCLLQ